MNAPPKSPKAVHILLELYDCDLETLTSEKKINSHMVEAAKKAGATILATNFHRFEPNGITGVIIIAESHLSIHTWPEFGYAAVDIFTCGDKVVPQKAIEILLKKMQPKSWTKKEFIRGLIKEKKITQH